MDSVVLISLGVAAAVVVLVAVAVFVLPALGGDRQKGSAKPSDYTDGF